jgi:hypothetical protein
MKFGKSNGRNLAGVRTCGSPETLRVRRIVGQPGARSPLTMEGIYCNLAMDNIK